MVSNFLGRLFVTRIYDDCVPFGHESCAAHFIDDFAETVQIHVIHAVSESLVAIFASVDEQFMLPDEA